MTLTVRPIPSRGREFRPFLELPYRLHRDLEHWVPPLRGDVLKLFDTGRNPFFEHAAVQAFVAERRPPGSAGRVVGRLAAIENHAHNSFYSDRVGFFGFFECEQDPEAAAALFAAAESWLRARGLDTMRGPMNFSTNDDCGLLIEGFHRPPSLLMPFNPRYYRELVEGAGFVKAKDLHCFWYGDDPPAWIDAAADRVQRRSKAITRPLDRERYEAEVDLIRSLYNSAWQRNWGFVPMTAREIEHLARELKPVIEPQIARFLEVKGEVVGFALALPDLNQVLRHLGGRLGPWQMLQFLWRRRRVNHVRVLTLGIREGHRSSGLDVLLYRDLFRAGVAVGMPHGEFSWVLEDNLAMVRPLERMGARLDRTYRIYDRPVPPA